MRLSFALFADAANLSQEGKLNILGVFDALQVASLPAVHPRAHLVVRLKGTRADVGRHAISLRWLNPNGDELWSSQGELNIAAPPAGIDEMDFPIIAALDLALDTPGQYAMQIALDGNTQAELRVQVAGEVAAPISGMVS